MKGKIDRLKVVSPNLLKSRSPPPQLAIGLKLTSSREEINEEDEDVRYVDDVDDDDDDDDDDADFCPL